MLIAGFPSDALGTNCWVVARGEGERCLVIDPGMGVSDQLDKVISEHALDPVGVLLTHGHFDHTFSATQVCSARGVPAYIHPADRGQLSDPWSGIGMPPGTPLLGSTSFTAPDDVRELTDGETLGIAETAGLVLRARHAPGHTPGSTLFELADGAATPVLFTGDVLFAGTIGRVDLPGGSMTEMQTSLRNIIVPMDDATVVHPGHGPSTTIGQERTGNPFLRELL